MGVKARNKGTEGNLRTKILASSWRVRVGGGDYLLILQRLQRLEKWAVGWDAKIIDTTPRLDLAAMRL